MLLIVGLGNPGRKYRRTRHNIGFMAVDRLAERLGAKFSRVRHKALIAEIHYEGKKLILEKPQTYMNRSGEAVSALVRYYTIPLSHLLVVYDDVDLPFGRQRLRPEGGAAGQKGMKSIIQQLGTEAFPRLRLGIGRPPGRMEMAAYVLQNFSAREAEALTFLLDRAADAILSFVQEGVEAAMTRFNAPSE